MEETQALPVFVLDAEPFIDWPVIVRHPVSGGQIAAHVFVARFRVASHAEYDRIFERAKVLAEGEEAAPVFTPPVAEMLAADAQRYAQLVVDWGGSQPDNWQGPRDSSGAPVPFSRERLIAEINGPRGEALADGLLRALHQIRWGEAAEKN